MEWDPTSSFALANMGVVQTLMGDLQEAEKSYLKALQLRPGELVAMSNLASLYKRLGQQREASYYQTKVKKFNQKNPYYHFSLGLEDYRSGQYKDSIAHFKSALRLKSSEHNFYMAMAKSYVSLGDEGKASECLKRAAKYAPDEAARFRYREKLALLAGRQPRS